MSKWDKYRIDDTKPVNRWDKYKISPVVEKQGDSWPSLIGKAALKGFSSIADVPKLVGQGVEGFLNAGHKMKGAPVGMYGMGIKPNVAKPNIEIIENAPQTNYADYIPSSEDLRSGINKYTGIDLEPRPTSPAQNVVSTGIDFGSAMLPWNLGGKASLPTKFKTAAKAFKEATAVGLGSGALQESGVNPFAADVISSVATPNVKPALQASLRMAKEAPFKMTGIGGNKLNVKAINAAKDLDIDLPAAVLTDSTLTGLLDQGVAKTPFFGNILKNKYDQVRDKAHKHLEKIYDEVGPIRTPEVSQKITDLYTLEKKTLPEEAFTIPTSTAKKINDINDSFYASFSSDGRAKLRKYIDKFKKDIEPQLNSKYGRVTLSSNGKQEKVKIPIQPYEIRKLIDSKIMINDIVNHDVKGEAINRLMEINHAISDDIARYGQTNPDWYKNFKEADKFFASVARREKTEKLLRNQATIGDAEELSYASLNNTINDNNTARLLKKNTPPETFEKIKKLGIISKAMVQKNRRVPNPSGTATTALALSAGLGFVSSLFSDPSKIINGGGLAAIVGTAAATTLLTDKRIIDLSLKLSQQHGKAKLATALQLNKRVKDVSGYTLNSIYQASRRNMNKEEEDGLQ